MAGGGETDGRRSPRMPPRTAMTPRMWLKHQACSAGLRGRSGGLLPLSWMFGWEAAGVAHRRVCASGYPGSPWGTASFWNPLLWWGGVKARFPLSLADPTAGWATLFGLEGAGFESEPASEML